MNRRKTLSRFTRFSKVLLSGAVLALTVLPAWSQPYDCSGISDVSDYDGANISDFDGDLTGVLVATGLTDPTFVGAAPGDVNRLFVLEQAGKIKIIKDGAVLATPFLDITSLVRSPTTPPPNTGGNEEGLLGLAFHPEYDTNGWFFIYYTNLTGSHNIVARYNVSANPDVALAASRVEVIAIPHPTGFDQDGGMLIFSPHDGYLYIGSGSDGNSNCDPMNNAQSLDSNLGKILRINVDSLPYSTAGNPYDGATAGNDEIWSYGLKNPWRFDIDPVTGIIVIGDVGEQVWEEVDCILPTSTGGENFGWRNYEGNACPSTSSCAVAGSCFLTNYVAPIRTYSHSENGFSCAVTGGYVYRGCRMSDLHGTYFYADYCNNFIRTFRIDETCATSALPDIDRAADLDPGGGLFISTITSFGLDARGELHVIDRAGEVFKILPTLGIMEVSGENAASVRMIDNGDWRWEDLGETSGHPIVAYKVYRADDDRTGPFVCVYTGPDNVWSGGDPDTPDPEVCFYYLVTALNATGEETRPGYESDGTPRVVNNLSTCP